MSSVVLLCSAFAFSSSVGAASGPKVLATSTSLNFGPVGVGATSPTLSVTIRNIGNQPLSNFAGGGVSNGFSASQSCVVAGGIAPGGSCQFFYEFAPSSAGAKTAVSTITTNGGSVAIALQGVGTSGRVVASPLAFDFGPVAVGASVSRTVTVRNVGLAPITSWAGGGVVSPFSALQNCVVPGGVVAGATCTFTYTFAPTAAGTFTATSNVASSGGSFSVTLKGVGDAGLAVANPLAIDFGRVPVGSSATRTISIRNAGIGPLTNWAGGGVFAPFGALQNCVMPGGLTRGASCQYTFTFSPTQIGSFTATSSSSTSGGSFVISMSGVGV